MHSHKTSTQSLTIVFAILFLLCLICGMAYCKTQKRKRRAITAVPQELPKAWFVVRPELIVPRRPLDRRRHVAVQAPQLLSDNINRNQFIQSLITGNKCTSDKRINLVSFETNKNNSIIKKLIHNFFQKQATIVVLFFVKKIKDLKFTSKTRVLVFAKEIDNVR